jgi:dihydrofolate synthase/folylpolyglutamate synthase
MSARGYREAVAALEEALVFGINPSLGGITQLTEALGRPQDSFASVQVAGTNGKTSTARLTAALLLGEGVRTGLYTSPHLERYAERIEVDGFIVSDEEFARAIGDVVDVAERLRPGTLGGGEGFTEFELLTAAALVHFAHSGVEVAVLEVGMGGRWDATSVVEPVVAVVTGIGLDHTSVLGDSLEQIAEEKAGIIGARSTVVLGPGTSGLERIFVHRAHSVGARVLAVREDDATSPLAEESTARFALRQRPLGPAGTTMLDVHGVRGEYDGLALSTPSYQAGNVATAVTAAEVVLGRALGERSARATLLGVRLPARFELVSAEPRVIVDGSHNPQAAAVLAEAIAEAWPDAAHRPHVLLGVLADKDAPGIIGALAEVAAGFSVCAPSGRRALPAEELAALVRQVTGRTPEVFANVSGALGHLLGSNADGLVVTGSLVTAAEARNALRESPRHTGAREGK